MINYIALSLLLWSSSSLATTTRLPLEELGFISAFTLKEKKAGLKLLEQHHPIGYAIYRADPVSFLDAAWWHNCNFSIVDVLVVALHETVHALSTNSYYLPGGQTLGRVNDTGLFPPIKIADQFANDRFKELYLSSGPESASSAQQFSFLLDELNAYSHGLATENALSKFVIERQWRSGAVAMMAYTKAYLSLAAKKYPRAWSQLLAQKATIGIIWSNAELTVKNSCSKGPPTVREDLVYLRAICSTSTNPALEQILGRKPECELSCF